MKKVAIKTKLISLLEDSKQKHIKTKNPLSTERVLYLIRYSSYASKGRIETYDLLSFFFWNWTTPSTLACSV